MDRDTVILFTRNGMGDAPQELQSILAGKFLGLLLESKQLPAKILFYTDGVKLVCKGSPIIESLQKMEKESVELIICKTCLDFFALTSEVQVGIVGGMGDIIEAMQKAKKVISL